MPNMNMKHLSKSDMMDLLIIWNANNWFRWKEGHPVVTGESMMKEIRPVNAQLLL